MAFRLVGKGQRMIIGCGFGGVCLEEKPYSDTLYSDTLYTTLIVLPCKQTIIKQSEQVCLTHQPQPAAARRVEEGGKASEIELLASTSSRVAGASVCGILLVLCCVVLAAACTSPRRVLLHPMMLIYVCLCC